MRRSILARLALSALALVAALGAAPLGAQSLEPTVQPVTSESEVRGLEHSLQARLDALGGVARITRCGPVLRLVVPGSDGYDQARGAVCALTVADHALTALMCDDARGLRFTLSLAATPDLDAMRRFIADNCSPAG